MGLNLARPVDPRVVDPWCTPRVTANMFPQHSGRTVVFIGKVLEIRSIDAATTGVHILCPVSGVEFMAQLHPDKGADPEWEENFSLVVFGAPAAIFADAGNSDIDSGSTVDQGRSKWKKMTCLMMTSRLSQKRSTFATSRRRRLFESTFAWNLI